MQFRLFVSVLAASAVVVGSIATTSLPSNAQTTTYSCGKSRSGVPTTYALTATGRRIPVIRWVRKIGNYTPQARCEEVSSRFQNAASAGVLNYITTDIKNGQKVLCAANRYGDPCSYLLLTLRPDDDAGKAIEDLSQVGSVVGAPTNHSDGSPKVFIDTSKLLREGQAEE